MSKPKPWPMMGYQLKLKLQMLQMLLQMPLPTDVLTHEVFNDELEKDRAKYGQI